jgi:hypothetical protein
MYLGDIGWGSVDWIQLAQDRVAGCCEYGDEPSGSGATELDNLNFINWSKCSVLFVM